MTTEEQCQRAQVAALTVLPPTVGQVVRARIIALRIAAGRSERLNGELDSLVNEVLAAAGHRSTEEGAG